MPLLVRFLLFAAGSRGRGKPVRDVVAIEFHDRGFGGARRYPLQLIDSNTRFLERGVERWLIGAFKRGVIELVVHALPAQWRLVEVAALDLALLHWRRHAAGCAQCPVDGLVLGRTG